MKSRCRHSDYISHAYIIIVAPPSLVYNYWLFFYFYFIFVVVGIRVLLTCCIVRLLCGSTTCSSRRRRREKYILWRVRFRLAKTTNRHKKKKRSVIISLYKYIIYYYNFQRNVGREIKKKNTGIVIITRSLHEGKTTMIADTFVFRQHRVKYYYYYYSCIISHPKTTRVLYNIVYACTRVWEQFPWRFFNFF